MRAAGLSVLLMLCGCVTWRQPPRDEGAFVLKLAPASLGRELSLAQRITMVRDGERRSFDGLLEVDAAEVRVALLVMGRTLGTLTWDGATFTQEVAAVVPEVVTAERIITDIQLAFWPEVAVREGLPPGFSLEEGEGQRVLLRDGEPWCTVTWDEGHRRVVLTHHRHGYALEIDSADALTRALPLPAERGEGPVVAVTAPLLASPRCAGGGNALLDHTEWEEQLFNSARADSHHQSPASPDSVIRMPGFFTEKDAFLAGHMSQVFVGGAA